MFVFTVQTLKNKKIFKTLANINQYNTGQNVLFLTLALNYEQNIINKEYN